MRIGSGIDFHQFEEGKVMVLGGHRLPFSYGFKAHSDGDVLLHALMDAFLGAMGLEDIGTYFPDNDPKYKNVDSTLLLEEVLEKMREEGYRLINADMTLVAQKPRLKEYKEAIKSKVAQLLQVELSQLSLKATTSEEMGAIGRGEGLCALCTVLLEKGDRKNGR